MASLNIDNTEIYARLAIQLGISRDSADWDDQTTDDVERIVRAGRRKFFSAYDWSFLEVYIQILTVAPYDTGTVEIVDGVVTLTGGTWPTGAASQRLSVDGGVYEVDTRDNGTQLTLFDTSLDVDDETEFVLYHTRYSLPTNFSAFVSPVTIENSRYCQDMREIPVLPEFSVRGLNSKQSAFSERPRAFSIFHTLDEETGIPTYFLDLYPLPDEVYTITSKVRINPGDSLAEVGDVFHASFSELMLEAILAAAEQIYGDGPGAHTQLFASMLPDFIHKDRVSAGARTMLPRGTGRGNNLPHNYELIIAPIEIEE